MNQEETASPTSGEIVWGDPRTSANDFQMINATTQDANNLELSLLYLQQSPTASGHIDTVSGTSVTFNHSDLYADEAFADGSGVVWNPEAGLYLNNSGEIMSPALNLASEFAHMAEPGGLGDNVTPDPVWGSPAEAIAHQAANVIAAELGEPIRDNYFDVEAVPVPDVLSSGSLSDVYGDAGISFDSGSFDAGASGADYGAADFGFDSYDFDLGDYGASDFGGSFTDGFYEASVAFV